MINILLSSLTDKYSIIYHRLL